MRTLAKPASVAAEVFQRCISRVADASLKTRLAAVVPDVSAEEQAFATAAGTASLHTLAPRTCIGRNVKKGELSAVYTQRMARKKSAGRGIYDSLMAAPAHGRCPLCAQRNVSTIDHHLPHTKYPFLAVVPLNLVPACSSCNKIKGTASPSVARKQTLFPYFDDVEAHLWLYAVVEESTPASVRFIAQPPSSLAPVMRARIRHHFSFFKLADLYTSHAGEELANISGQLDSLYDKGGEVAVKSHLEDLAVSRTKVHLNAWQSALYSALAASAWYCGGGFR